MDPTLVAHRQRFLAFLEHRVGSRALAEELLQSAFLRTLQHDAAPEAVEDVVTWFYRVLRNALVDHHRRQSAEGRAVDRMAQEPAAAEPEDRGALCACLGDLLPSLKPEYSELLRRVDLDERPVSEVAAALGISSNNASVRLHRARQALKRALERACGTCAVHGCLDCGCGHSKSPPPTPL